MKFYEALKLMQEEDRVFCTPASDRPNLHYYWGDVLEVPCLKNSDGEEVLANSWSMKTEWAEVCAKSPEKAK